MIVHAKFVNNRLVMPEINSPENVDCLVFITKSIRPDFDYNSSLEVEDIQEAVFDVTKVNVSELCSGSRIGYITLARHLSIFFCRKFTPLGMNEIAISHGLTNHSTVIHALKNVDNLLFTEQNARQKPVTDFYNEILLKLTSERANRL